MIHKIYSKLNPEMLLHLVCRPDWGTERVNVSPDDEFLQVAVLKLKTGATFKPHKHIVTQKITDIAQESWCVLNGSVKCFFYDTDDSIIEEIIIRKGDFSMTFRGGHNYLILEDDTIVYEYKTGPYLGQELDKVFI